MTRRFDRGADNERLHVQTLCALGHLDNDQPRTHSYASYFWVGRQLGLGPEDARQMFRRIVFNVMGANRDDHTKNFSFVLSEHGRWRLAPAYDVTHSYWDGEWTQTHQMSVNGRFSDITLDDLREMAERNEVPGIESTLGEVASAIDDWPSFARDAAVDERTVAKIAGDIDRLRPR